MGKYMKNLYKKIERERYKLTRLVNQAIKENQPIGTNSVILTRSRKLDLLIEKL